MHSNILGKVTVQSLPRFISSGQRLRRIWVGQKAKLVLKLLASLGLLGLLGWFIDLGRVARVIAQVDLWLVAAAVGAFTAGQALNALKWYWIGRALDLKASARTYLRLYGLGLCLGIFLPGSVGGDLGRAVLLARQGYQGWATTYSVLADRYSGLLFLLVLSSLAIPGIRAYAGIAPWLWGLTALLLVLWLFLGWAAPLARSSGKLRTYLLPLRDWEQELRTWQNLLRIGAGSLLIQVANWLVLVLLATALHMQVAAAALLVAYGLITIASLAPVSLNGLGIREGGYVLLLGSVGVPPEQAVSLGVLWFAVFLCAGLLGGLSWLVEDPAISIKAG